MMIIQMISTQVSEQPDIKADPGQPLVICVRVVKPDGGRLQKPVYREDPWTPNVPPIKKGPKTFHYGDHYIRPGR